MRNVLIYGYGNPGRRDDGLGPALVAALEPLGLEGVTLDSNYQLSVEDAAAVAAHDAVVFVDADATGPEPFRFCAVEPAYELGFSTHSVRPEAVLGLANGRLGGSTAGFVLGIRGYEFDEFAEALTDGAARNLDAALAFLGAALAARRFEDYVGDHESRGREGAK